VWRGLNTALTNLSRRVNRFFIFQSSPKHISISRHFAFVD